MGKLRELVMNMEAWGPWVYAGVHGAVKSLTHPCCEPLPDQPSGVAAIYKKKVEYSARARTRGSTVLYKGVGRQPGLVTPAGRGDNGRPGR